ncbi:hypothetical protein PC121_g6187 [Phytophthora cactorum]|nr:hypothetical protein PC121_g6187 [Phytophthora cactorum]
MMSAIVVGQTVKNLSMILLFGEYAGTSSEDWWKYIAYGFFSKRARDRSSLESLALVNIPTLVIEDMEGFPAIANAEHPEEVLFNCPRGQIDERYATLEANSPIRWNFNYEGQLIIEEDTYRLTFLSPLQSIWTFRDDGTSDWVNVMIPGFGRCRVRRSDLEFDETSLTSMKPVDGLRDDLDERVILDCCPNLESLYLCGGLVDVELSLGEFRIMRQASLQQRIDWQIIASLAAALSDRDNALATCVRRM